MMHFLKKAFVPKEAKVALGALDEAAIRFQTEAFQTVRREIEKLILTSPGVLARVIRESDGRTPREWVYSQIGNIAGDLLETGQFHVYRGVLNSMSIGPDLLKMFDATYDELVQMRAVSQDYAKEQKRALRKNMRVVG